MVARATTRATSMVTSKVTTSGGGGASGGGGGSEPTLPEIAGLGLWLDSADAATVFNSVSPDVSATDAQTIRRWIDKSTNAFDFNQTTGLNQPLYETNEINNRNVSEWDGANDLLLGTLPNFSTCTIFRVSKSSKTTGFLWLSDVSGQTQRFGLVSQSGSVLAASGVLGTPSFRKNGASVSISTRGDVYTQLTTNEAVIIAIVGANVSQWSKSTGEFAIGYPSSASFSPQGNLCELLIYNGTLSIENIAAVESYLATKWGVTLA